MSKTVALILIALLPAVWMAGTFLAAHLFVKEEKHARAKWTTVQGTITSSKSSYHPAVVLGPEDIGAQDHNVITVQFSYEVGGVGYSSKQKWTDLNGPGRMYSPGSHATVYYNPNNPAEAVVEPDEPSFEGVGCIMWAWAIVVFVVILVIWGMVED